MKVGRGLSVLLGYLAVAWAIGLRSSVVRSLQRHGMDEGEATHTAFLIGYAASGSVASLATLAAPSVLGIPKLDVLPEGANREAACWALVGGLVGGFLFQGERLVVRVGHPEFCEAVVEGSSRIASGAAAQFPPQLPLTCVGAITEEILWRGVLLDALDSLGPLSLRQAAVISSIAFGLIHFPMGLRNITLKATAGLAWVFLGQASGNLLAPILSHVVFNLLIYRQQRSEEEPSPGSAALSPLCL